MNFQLLTQQYLNLARTMQLATVADGQPWVCSVYFVADDSLNFYWLSYPNRRHSIELAHNNKVAITVPIKYDQPVIGIQAEGNASIVSDEIEIKEVMEKYTDKYDSGHKFYENFVSGINKHHMFKFIPRKMYLFDEVNFPGGERQEVPC